MSTQSHLYLILGLPLLTLSLAAQPANLIFGTAETQEQFIQAISTAINDIVLFPNPARTAIQIALPLQS